MTQILARTSNVVHLNLSNKSVILFRLFATTAMYPCSCNNPGVYIDNHSHLMSLVPSMGLIHPGLRLLTVSACLS